MKETEWVYICNRNDQCKRPCDKECFYTHDFFKSRAYQNPIKPITLTFAKTADKDKDVWIQVDPDRHYPLPKMDSKNTHFTSKYSDFESWVFSMYGRQMLNKKKKLGVDIFFNDGTKKSL